MEEQGHDGYCSEVMDTAYLDVVKTEERTYFVPADSYTADKTEWEARNPDHCCCGSMFRYSVKSVERSE
jgi:hypothetical protein